MLREALKSSNWKRLWIKLSKYDFNNCKQNQLFWFYLVPLCEHPSKKLRWSLSFIHIPPLSPSSLSVSLPITLSVSSTVTCPHFTTISFSTHSCALQSKQPNKFKQEQYGLPHVLFLISPVFKQWFTWHLISFIMFSKLV